jgi:rfaE bifunctional protein nucleotidyltransferase chain/domain
MVDLATARSRIATARAVGLRVAFTNGCFDLLHIGHARLLMTARATADLLVVAINSDASVRRLKGEGRPRVPAAERAFMLALYPFVDLVVVFEEDDVGRLLRTLRPDVHCKGTDYTVDSVPEREIVRSYGGRVAIVGDPKEHDTSRLLARIRS